ncbi:MAG: response regulator transcription factor [Verrucomicrobiota bacterium]|jgi:DNA-binding NarL/FixJ family response regulator
MSVLVSIVEDDASVRKLLAEWIDQAPGFNCLSQHANAEAALAQLPIGKPTVVLMDINLPDLTGIECVRRLKPVMPETHFVMLTVYEDSNHIFDALAAGAVGYLLKQTPCDQLIKSLKQVCAGGSPMSGYIARKVVQFFQQGKPAAPGVEVLTARERQVLELLARGYLYKEITESLGITGPTVNAHVRRIYEKLQVHTRTQAVVKYFKSQGRQKESSPAVKP